MTSHRFSQTNDADAGCISRADLALRWRCHTETIKRKEKQGLLHPIRLSPRMVRYALREIQALEHEAEGNPPPSTRRWPMKQTQRRKVSTLQPSPEMERKGVIVELEP